MNLIKTFVFAFSAVLTKVFSHPEDRQIENGSPLTTLPVFGVEWSVSFKVKLSSFAKGYAHCLNLVKESGQKIVKVVLTSDKKFRVFFGYPFLNAATDYIEDHSLPSLGVWTKIEIAQVMQGSTTNIVFMKNDNIVGKLENPQPKNMFAVNVFVVKPGITFQPGTIKELTIRTDLSGSNLSQNYLTNVYLYQ